MENNTLVPLGVHRARCQSCSHAFEAFKLSVFLHGEKLFHTADGRGIAYTNYLENPVAGEVRALLGEMDVSLSDPSLVDAAVIAASDPVNGMPLDPARTTPTCPKCGASEVDVETQRSRSDHFEVPHLGHTSWSKLSPEEKKKVLKSSLNGRV